MRYSIVIPTRDRADTLAAALQSCLAVDYSDYEIVVCDNCSSPKTAEVVSSFNSNKIVYHRSDKPLSMGENWNLAYSLTSGDFIIYIGDDDAVLPFALKALDLIISKYKTEVVRWTCGMYGWPNVAAEDLRNYFALCYNFTCKWTDGRGMIREVITFSENAAQLPNIYHGCVSRAILENIKAVSGHVFASYHCDTYCSVAVAYTATRYINLAAALTISGFSGHSNNIAFSFLRGKHKNHEAYRQQNSASGITVHPHVPDILHPIIPIINSFLIAKGELFPSDDTIFLDRGALVNLLLEDPAIDEIDEWAGYLAEIRRSVEDDAVLLSLIDAKLKVVVPKTTLRPRVRQPFEGAFSEYLLVSADDFGVKTVFDAAKLADKIVNFSTLEFRDSHAFGEKLRRKFVLSRRQKLLTKLREDADSPD